MVVQTNSRKRAANAVKSKETCSVVKGTLTNHSGKSRCRIVVIVVIVVTMGHGHLQT